MSNLENLLRPIPELDPDKLFPLLAGGPGATEKLLGVKHHKSILHRWETKGSYGIRLATITAGRTRYTSLRMLAVFFIESDKARRERQRTPEPVKSARRSRPESPTTSAAEECVLARANVGQKSNLGRKVHRPGR